MKNDKMKKALERELTGVHVSRDLKRRIMAEAAASRAPSKRTVFSIRPLAIAAAVMVTIGLSAGVIALRAEKPDLSAATLSPNNVSESVWVWKGGDGLYHSAEACGEQRGMTRARPEDARAEGLKACSACFEAGDKAVENLVWMMQQGSVYHDVPDCSGMEGALGVLEIEAKTLGKQPCGICLGGEMIETWPELVEDMPMPTPMPTQDPGQYQTLPWQEPGQGEVVYAFGTPEPTVPPRMTPPPTPMRTEENDATPAATAIPEEMMAKPTPEPTVAPTVEVFDAETSAEEVEERLFWMTDGNAFYHADEHCSGMEDAGAVTRGEALMAEKKPCEICTERILWTADGGKSCHLAKNCSGIEDAEMIVLQPGDTTYQVGCLVCAAGGFPVWVAENSEFHHLDENCSGMENAVQIMQSEALAERKQACPVCMLAHKTDGASAVFVTRDADEKMVWMKETDAQYYHSDEYCASYLTVEELYGMGKEPCAVCGAEGLDDEVKAYSDDEFYHADKYCTERNEADLHTVSEAEAYGRKPCVLCLSEETVKPYYDGNVWMTENGDYYHRARSCSGMVGARKNVRAEAVNQGKQKCPICMDETPVWMSEEEKYYHLYEYCAYGNGSLEVAESVAKSEGKLACPKCLATDMLDAGGGVFVSTTSGEAMDVFIGIDPCYHANELCDNLEVSDGHTIVAETGAIAWGKVPCEICFKERYENRNEVDYEVFGNELAAEAVVVWMADGGLFYHSDEHCSGMNGAQGCTVVAALMEEKEPCPTCAKQFSEVWATEAGVYYHLTEDCMSVIGEQKLSGSEAAARGLRMCPVCRAALSEVLTVSTES